MLEVLVAPALLEGLELLMPLEVLVSHFPLCDDNGDCTCGLCVGEGLCAWLQGTMCTTEWLMTAVASALAT